MFNDWFIVGYSYLKDIRETKGRRSRKVFPQRFENEIKSKYTSYLAKDRIAAGDPNFTKFLEKKERAAVHHH